MYRTINFVESTRDFCSKIINIERERNRQYYEIALDFVKNNNCIIGGKLACDIYINNKVDIDRIVIDAKPILIFSDDAFKTATDLADALYAATKNDKVFVWPIFSGDEYEIMIVGSRKLCIIRHIGEYKETGLTKLMHAKKISGLQLMNAEVLLIDIYRNFFYDVDDDPDEIDKILEDEAALFKHFVADVKKGKFDLVEGGKENKSDDSSIHKLRKKLTAALSDSSEASTVALNSTQFVTSLPDHEIQQRITGSLAAAGFEINTAKYGLSLPVDGRLRRFRIFKVENGRRERVADIFNAGQYDLYAIHPFLRLRFIFVDLWTINLIFAIGEINKDSAQREINRLIDEAIAVHGEINRDQKLEFHGTYVDEVIARRRAKKFAKRNNDELYYAALANKK